MARDRQLVDHLFRHAAGRMVARLTRGLGPRHFGLAEEAVQEALLSALERWSYYGVPDEPEAWLMRVARNRIIDRLRRDRRFGEIVAQLAAQPEDFGIISEDALVDDELLPLMFACADPRLAVESQLSLILKAVCGFGVTEIAAALLATPAAIEKRLSRAKSFLRRQHTLFDMDRAEQVESRLPSVLDALYLMFSEGYHAVGGDSACRYELCREAIRLGEVLTKAFTTRVPTISALLALMYFDLARVSARNDDTRGLLSLAEQDRTKWDAELIARGFRLLDVSAQGEQLSRFHLEAAISAEHCRAKSLADTDLTAILTYYNMLEANWPSPVITLNRAIILAERDGPAAGLVALDAIAPAQLTSYPFLHAARGEFLHRLQDEAGADTALKMAIATARSGAERQFFTRRRRQMHMSCSAGAVTH